MQIKIDYYKEVFYQVAFKIAPAPFSKGGRVDFNGRQY